ncbi:flagellar basal-body rod protein FlgG [Gammaproteobacteria bacterium 45_16_T64]|nr:flagellar basal-body rod protein FlgG [Gammaproteobacteria bacterium 45_16_T64]
MFDALYIAATGMQSEKTLIDNISNNLANLNTPGFKKTRVEFTDLMYADSSNATSELSKLDSEVKMGMGSSITAVNRDFSAGDLKTTENPMDLAINGEGFFEVELGNGEYAYTRIGSLRLMDDGFLSTVAGKKLSANINVPLETTRLIVNKDGLVQAQIAQEDELVELGQMDIVKFPNAQDLDPIGSGMYLATEKSGGALYSEPGENGAGQIVQGFIETSNVDLVAEMIDLVVAQRAYEVSSQIIRASDEMLKITNNLRG